MQPFTVEKKKTKQANFIPTCTLVRFLNAFLKLKSID